MAFCIPKRWVWDAYKRVKTNRGAAGVDEQSLEQFEANVKGNLYTRISDIAVVPYRQDQAPRLDFWGSAVRNDTREGDTLWVNYTWSHFSSRSTVS